MKSSLRDVTISETVTFIEVLTMNDKEEIIYYEHAIGLCRAVLRMLGVWPEDCRKNNLLSRYRFLVPAMITFCFCTAPQAFKAVEIRRDLNEFLGVLTTFLISIATALFKTIGLWYNRNGKLVATMLEDWNSPKTPDELMTMKKNAELSRVMSIIIIALAEGTISMYLVISIVERVSESNLYRSGTVNTSDWRKSYYLNSIFFYDIQSTPSYQIVWFLQFLSTLFPSLIFSAADAFFAVLVLHLCGQLRILTDKLVDLPKNYNGKEFARTIAIIVTRHNQLSSFLFIQVCERPLCERPRNYNILGPSNFSSWVNSIMKLSQENGIFMSQLGIELGFSNTIEEAFNVIFLVQIMASAMVVCLQGYQLVIITTGGDGISFMELIFMLQYVSCFIFSVFIYCYIAEILRTESTRAAHAAYESEWYNLSPEKTKLLLLIIVRARLPFELTAGKFSAFSLELFCSILKSCGGYLSMLLAMRDRLTD